MQKLLYALALMFGMAGLASYANYAATVGSGTTFNSFDVGGVKAAGVVITDAASGATDVGAAILTAVQAPIPSGSNIIGNVRVDQTTPGTTNGVALAQIGSTTTASGNGVVGAGVQRVAIASDNTAFSVNATLGTETTKVIGTVGQLPYPVGSTPYTATATGTTGATTATLAGASSVTTYLCGFSIRANATAAATGNATVTGVITATLNFTQWTAPNASGLGITEMIFAPCIPASGTNQSVAVVSAAPGTGGVVSVTAWGYKL